MDLIRNDVLITLHHQKWPVVGGLSTGSDGRIQQKAISNLISTVGKVHKLLSLHLLPWLIESGTDSAYLCCH